MNRFILSALLVPAALALAPTGAKPVPPMSRAAELFPPAREGLTILGRGDDSAGPRPPDPEAPRMDDLLREYGRVTGMTICFNQETANMLRSSTPPNLDTIEVPAERVHATVQGLLFLSDFAVLPLTEEPPYLVAVQSLQQQSARSNLKQNALVLAEEELDAFRDYAALLVTIPVHLEHIDVRQLATSLRPLMPDQSTSSMLNAGSTNSMILTGFAGQISAMIDLFRTIDAQEAERLARQAAQAPPEDAEEGDEDG